MESRLERGPVEYTSMATATTKIIRESDGDQCVELRDVSSSEIHEWVPRLQPDSETKWIQAFRRWVKATVVPRALARGNSPLAPDCQQTDSSDRKES
jgi:hypothetical protein